MFHIDRFDFNSETPVKVSKLHHGKTEVGANWPVVYVINNDTEAYVGETVHAYRRIEQHQQTKARQRLTEIRIISDDNFNKSVVLDLESFLIKYMSSDEKYVLQNGNSGISDHDYFDRSAYRDEFIAIWNKLRKMGIAQKTIEEIENSEIYKYSPYKSLGEEQTEAVISILKLLAGEQEKPKTIIVRGGAGTGKTIVAIYLLKYLVDLNDPARINDEETDEEPSDSILDIYASDNIRNIVKIGIVVPQKSLQSSLKDVFKGVRLLDKSMVLTPAEVVDDYEKTGRPFDLLIVDEAHRLRCRYRGNVSHHPTFIKRNRLLGLDERMGTELDWIMLCSRNQVLFRDELQTVRPCDLREEEFIRILHNHHRPPDAQLALDTQWRCMGGSDYTHYIRDIFSDCAAGFREIKNYDLKLYLDCHQMYEDIRKKNDEMDLCRMAAGYAWPWDRKNPDAYTIRIQEHEYRWNRVYDNWITSKTAPEEIGCIHTLQGYDLNYAGVIIGDDIRYDAKAGKIVSNKASYYDTLGKAGVSDDPEGLKNYLCNIYITLLTRGIHGTYLYVCDDALREHLKNFFPVKGAETSL